MESLAILAVKPSIMVRKFNLTIISHMVYKQRIILTILHARYILSFLVSKVSSRKVETSKRLGFTWPCAN